MKQLHSVDAFNGGIESKTMQLCVIAITKTECTVNSFVS